MSEVITVGSPAPELLANAEDMLAVANSYRIDCIEMRVAASEDLKRVKGLAKDLDTQRKSITRPLDEAKARVMDLFRKPAEYLERAEQTIKRACLAWDGEQDRIRRAAEAEAARRADEERRRLQEQAKQAEAEGKPETAHAIAQAAQFVAPVPVQQERQKIAGEATRELWHAEVDDIVALARAVADGKVSPENLLPNMPVLNQQARALKGSLAIPGVRAVSERVLGARAA